MVAEFLEKDYVNCLTFPADVWEYERDLAINLPQVKFWFEAVEQDRNVHHRSLSKMRVLNNTIPNGHFVLPEHPCSLKQRLGDKDEPWTELPFDLVYPDWMGTWNQDKKEETRRMFVRRIFSYTSFLSITIQLSRGQPLTMHELEQIVLNLDVLTIEDLDLDERTRRAIRETKTGSIKAEGVTGYIQELGRKNGYLVTPLHVRVYDSLSSVREGFFTPEMRFLYRIEDQKS